MWNAFELNAVHSETELHAFIKTLFFLFVHFFAS